MYLLNIFNRLYSGIILGKGRKSNGTASVEHIYPGGTASELFKGSREPGVFSVRCHGTDPAAGGGAGHQTIRPDRKKGHTHTAGKPVFDQRLRYPL